jgi:glycerol uptake facilitator protein
MSPFLGEFVGSALLLLLGGGVVANVVLNNTKGNAGGWIVIAFGWSMAVFVGVYSSVHLGGSGHINPAVSIALASTGDFDGGLLGTYIVAQFLGTFTGSVLAWLSYKPHFDSTGNADLKLAVFCTAPAVRKPVYNFITEFIGTLVLMLGALVISKPSGSMGALDALPVAFLVLAIGLSLGGPTGYAINPARDLGPRIAHAILPIRGKRDSDWAYAWIPVLAPIAGATLGAWIYVWIS